LATTKHPAEFAPGLTSLLCRRAAEEPNREIFRFLSGEGEISTITCRELDLRARSLAILLRKHASAGERVLLLCPPGIDYIVSFFGCMYAGLIAVPSYPPARSVSDIHRSSVWTVAADARPAIILTTQKNLQRLAAVRDQFSKDAVWLTPDLNDVAGHEDWHPVDRGADALAYLQYTSGSTTKPRGVMVSHGNLVHNAAYIHSAFGLSADLTGVFWLPPYHDMGLIGGILQPVFSGFTAVLMPPGAFIQRPMLWLETISRYRAAVSGGPNFAYDLCARRFNAADVGDLDLGCWKIAFNGAEPVRAETLRRFASSFAPYGFRATAFQPCYGLAEATLLVSAGGKMTGPVTVSLDLNTLGRDRVEESTKDTGTSEFVSCGAAETTVEILKPGSSVRCAPDEIGEILVSGPGVTQGYWEKPEETERTFQARVEGTSAAFLRTGDLGFIRGGELFITGRLKDLIIIRGRNYYPADIEETARACMSAFADKSCAALSLEAEGEAHLLVLQECPRKPSVDPQEAFSAIRQAVASTYQLQTHTVALISQFGLPKTTSGKIQRSLCLKLFLEGALPVIASSTLEGADEELQFAALRDVVQPESQSEFIQYLTDLLARKLGISRSLIDPGKALETFGLDSLLSVQIAMEVEGRFGVALPPATFLDTLSLEDVAFRLASARSSQADEAAAIRETDEFTLSQGQQALWFLQQLAPSASAYNIARAFRLEGQQLSEILPGVLAQVTDRHPSLRARFSAGQNGPVQTFSSSAPLNFEVLNGRSWGEQHLAKELEARAQRPFALESDTPLRVTWIETSDTAGVLLLVVHHIVADRWSFDILLEDIAALCNRRGGISALAAPGRIISYLEWQSKFLESAESERVKSYWIQKLGGELPVLNLAGGQRPRTQTFNGARLSVNFRPAIALAVAELAKKENTTLFVLLLAVFDALLYRYSGKTDLPVGIPVAGRSRAAHARVVGYLVNPVVIRADLLDAPAFRDLYRQLRRLVIEGMNHADYPFPLLAQHLQPERDPSYPPLFQVLFYMESSANVREAFGLAEINADPVEIDCHPAQFDLSLRVEEVGGVPVSAAFDYNTDLFSKTAIGRMAEHFNVLLEDLVAHPEISFSDAALLTEAERTQLLAEWSGGAFEGSDECVHQLVEAQVERSPDAEAIISGEDRITYQELDRRANCLAWELAAAGAGPEIPVAVCLERSTDLIVSLLAVLKSGATYIPMDPAYPPEFLAQVLRESRAQFLLTQENLRDRVPAQSAKVICIESADFGKDAPRLNTAVLPENLAYIIFTSGSTGTPKGVAIEHRNCAAFLKCAREVFPLTAEDVVLASTSICFDISIIEMFLTLTSGAKMAIAFNVLELSTLPAREEVTLIDTVPSGMAQLLSYGPLPSRVSTVSLGGEALSSELVKRAYGAGVERVVNIYGPTEDTTFSTFECVPPAETGEPTIGRPLRGKHTYILDAAMNLCPVGVAGEVYVGGTGVVRGYAGQPMLTAERFVPHPFAQTPGLRLYRVGDLGRWCEDGRLEYLGRVDFQVKVRGFRIELGNIEATLRAHSAIRQAVVVVHQRKGAEKQLVAYVVLTDKVSAQELRAFMREHLPEYMVPSRVLELDALPLSPNGKINRKALPDPDSLAHEDEEAAPVHSATEQAVAAVWAEILGVEVSDRHANFFEAGGHSLLATQVVSRMRHLFGVDLPLRTLFEEPTVAGLSACIERMRSQSREQGVSALVAHQRPEKIPLSYAQQRLWFLEQMHPGDPTYVIAAGMWMHGTLDIAALKASLNSVVERHEALRTCMEMQDGVPYQIVSSSQELEFPVTNLTMLGKEEQRIETRRQLHQMADPAFDLTHGPLIRAHLWKLGAQENCLGLAIHHIVADGWSMGLLLRELKEFYEACVAGRQPNLRPLAIQYADYAIWQREWLQIRELDRQLEYWRAQLQDITALRLPQDRPHPPVRTGQGATYRWELTPALLEDLRVLSRKQGVTLFMTMLGALQVLLARYNGNGDIAIGSVIANRNRQEIEDLIGFFVNTVVLRTEVQSWRTFEELLSQVRKACLEAYAHQDLPFEKLVEALQPERDLGRQPFFQALLALQNAPLPEMEMGGVRLHPVAVDSSRSRFDLSFMVESFDKTWTVVTEYNTDIFDRATIERICRHYHSLLQQAAALPGKRISEFVVLEESERKQLLAWSGGEQFHDGVFLHKLFEEQAEKTPGADAVVFGPERLSYAGLHRRANQLAHYLCSLGAGPEVVIGLCVERSVEMIVGMLAILKAGAVFLPLEPRYPAERLSFMVQDAQALMVLTQGPLQDRLSGTGSKILVMEEFTEIARQPEDNPVTTVDPENLAYIIYTSGSTGRPKGVGISHRSVCPLIEWGKWKVQMTPEDRVLQNVAFGFDWSIWEMMITLCSGAALYLMAEKSPLQTERLIQENGITVFHATPTEVEMLAATGCTFGSLRMVLVGGEKSDWHTLECIGKLAGENCSAVNMYGPTEASIVTVADFLSPTEAKTHDMHENVPIGLPVANTTCYILDADLNLCAQGVVGELYLGGVELARGYIGQPALTAEKFIPDLFGKSEGGRLYKTGDLTRWRPDGRLGYLGRADQQVKIRGFRIELGEIESVLRSHPGVHEAVVVVKERENGDKGLLAYVVGERTTGQDLRSFLREHLPEYMVPAQVMHLESMPLSANGKINRRALPEPESFDQGRENAAPPCTATEEILATLWSAVLGHEMLDREANFFELGGHSLLATQVMSRIRQIFGVELPLRTFFEEPTLAQLGARIDRTRQQDREPNVPKLTAGRRPQVVPLSHAQQRLWFLEQIEPGGPVYVIVAAVRLVGRLEVEVLRHALNRIVERHEVLRTQVVMKAEMPAQEILECVELQLEEMDLSHVEMSERTAEAQRQLQQMSGEGFDLSRAPLLRARLLKLHEQERWLVFSMHHIASDGWSMGVLLQELKEFYQSQITGAPVPLEPLAVQYADYACWQREWLQGGELDRQLEYWRKQLNGMEDLRLPLDRPYPPLRSGRGASYRWRVPEPLYNELKKFSRKQGVTYFMTLLAGLQALLARYTGQSDISIGTVIANRNRQEVEGLIGFFTNTVLLRKEIAGSESLRQLVVAAREVSLQAYAHQDLPFEKLVEALQPERDPRKNPLVQVMLAFQNAPLPELELGELKLEPLGIESERARFDLTMEIQPDAEGWRVAMEYNTDIFDRETIQMLALHYQRLLEAAVASPDLPVAELEFISDEERREIETWSALQKQYKAELCLHEFFEQQVQQRGTAEAICYGTQKLSYAELNQRANALAHRLLRSSFGPEAMIGLCMNHSVDRVIAMLAILKSGACCLILDHQDPEERLNTVLRNAQPRMVITQRNCIEKLAADVKLLVMEEEAYQSAGLPTGNCGAVSGPENLAYVIYGSSSTGIPQGTALSHRNIGRLISATRESLEFNSQDTWYIPFEAGPDASIWEIWSALLCGGRLVIADKPWSGIATLLDAIRDHRITVFNSVSIAGQLAILSQEQLQGNDSPLRYVLLNGEGPEPYSPPHGFQFIRTRGSAETSMYSRMELSHGNMAALSDVRVYVLDPDGKLAPKGVPGEVFIGGDAVARGYAGSAELTAEKFVPDPLSNTMGARLYRSGELACWRTGGKLEYLGRLDRQTEVRGVCFHPAEVESALCTHATVRQAVVVARASQHAGKILVAYVVPSGNLHPDLPELQAWLGKHLPAAMVPEELVWIDALPLDAKGKINYRALPDPRTAAQKALGLVQPRNPAEVQVANIWGEVLSRSGFGVHDNFFDVGGTSLQVVLVVSKLRKAFDKQIPVTTLFAYPTIATMAEYLASQKTVAAAASAEAVDSRKQAIQQQQELRRKARSRGAEGTA
jgi:amino acid adenylation domain-containing protein